MNNIGLICVTHDPERFNRIKELQEQGICFGCYNFKTGDIFTD